MIPMPWLAASRTEGNVIGLPSSKSRPDVGCSTPARIFINVDLPAPFSPTSTLTAPLRTSKLALSSATVPGNTLLTSTADKTTGFIGASTIARTQAHRCDGRLAGHRRIGHRADELDRAPDARRRDEPLVRQRRGAVVERARHFGVLDLIHKIAERDERQAVAHGGAEDNRPDLQRHCQRMRRRLRDTAHDLAVTRGSAHRFDDAGTANGERPRGTLTTRAPAELTSGRIFVFGQRFHYLRDRKRVFIKKRDGFAIP